MTNLEEHTTIKNNGYRRFINCTPLIYKLADMHILKHFSLLSVCTILFINSIHSQSSTSNFPYQKLYDSASALMYTNPALALKINNTILKKAKSEGNTPFLVRAYSTAALLAEYPIGNSYMDSVIGLGDKIPVDMKYPTRAYILKGYLSYINNQYSDSFDSFVKAQQSAIDGNQPDLEDEILQYIAAIKNIWGQHEDAEIIYQNKIDKYNLLTEKTPKQQEDYNILLVNLIFSQNRSKKYTKALNNIKKAEHIINKTGDSTYYESIKLNKGIANYYLGDPTMAYKIIDSLGVSNSIDTQTDIHLQKGIILASENNFTKAIVEFNKMDSIIVSNNLINPDYKEGYKTLLDIYKFQNIPEKQVQIIEKLLWYDSIIQKDYSYLTQNIYHKYDKANLMEDKNRALNNLSRQRNSKFIILYTAIGLFVFLGLIYLYNQKKQKEKFALLLKSITEKKQTVNEPTVSIINDDLHDDLLIKLNAFERNKEFTDRTITLSNLASELNTNSTYLSKFINESKGVSFSDYLKTLRIDYATSILLENNKLRNYTIEALAQEFGFKSGNSFSKAFILITNMKPSEFIKQAGKIKPT